MNTREIAEEYRLTHWAAIMRERKESGQSIRVYCRQTGMHENVYYYWQRKLREAAYEQMPGGSTSIAVPGFAEVQVAERTSEGCSGAGRISVEVGGIQISADSGYPAEQLAALLRELRRSC